MALYTDSELGQGLGPGEVVDDVDDFSGYVDYFGFDETLQYKLPDGRQYIEYKKLNEGARARYEAQTSRDVKFNRKNDDASIRVNPADDRHALIRASVVNWNMVTRRNGRMEPVAFNNNGRGSTFDQWMEKADPKIINGLYNAIREANGWLVDELSVEMIDEEIARLEELRKIAVEREITGKVS